MGPVLRESREKEPDMLESITKEDTRVKLNMAAAAGEGYRERTKPDKWWVFCLLSSLCSKDAFLTQSLLDLVHKRRLWSLLVISL